MSKQPSVSSWNMHTAEYAWLSPGVAYASPVTFLSTGDHHSEDEALFLPHRNLLVSTNVSQTLKGFQSIRNYKLNLKKCMYVCMYVSGKGMSSKQMHHELELGLIVVLALVIAIWLNLVHYRARLSLLCPHPCPYLPVCSTRQSVEKNPCFSVLHHLKTSGSSSFNCRKILLHIVE